MKHIQNLIDEHNIEGYLSFKEGSLLYDLAKNCRGKGVIVEIGSWKGKSTVWIGSGNKRSPIPQKIYAVDPHEGIRYEDGREPLPSTLDTFKENIEKGGVAKQVEPIVNYSAEAAKDFDKPIEFIFIDGLHEYDNVKVDFESWYPKVIEGGIMAFHDTSNDASGAKRYVEERLYGSSDFKNIRLRDSITYAVKVKRNNILDRLKNRFNLFSKRQHENESLPKWIRKIFKQLLRI